MAGFIDLSKDFWEDEYANQYEKQLEEEKERPRYDTLARLIQAQTRHLSVLDLGCGTGIMKKYLPDNILTGVDISADAIRKARRSDPESEYICAPIEAYNPTGKFDIILFNEILYYLPDAYGSVCFFSKYLHDDGTIILSVYNPGKAHRFGSVFCGLIEEIKQWDFSITEEIELANGGLSWKIICLKRK